MGNSFIISEEESQRIKSLYNINEQKIYRDGDKCQGEQYVVNVGGKQKVMTKKELQDYMKDKTHTSLQLCDNGKFRQYHCNKENDGKLTFEIVLD